jgi:hypothetical protein
MRKITPQLLLEMGFQELKDSSGPKLWRLVWQGKQCGLSNLETDNMGSVWQSPASVRCVFMGLSKNGEWTFRLACSDTTISQGVIHNLQELVSVLMTHALKCGSREKASAIRRVLGISTKLATQ